jgi:hypothetical protein
MQKKIKIGILDTGVNQYHPELKKEILKGFSLEITNNIVIQKKDYKDSFGHGTAIYYLINKHAKDIDITNIKIMESSDKLKQNDLERILEYIYYNCNFDILNISLGIVQVSSVARMQDICTQISKKGCIIVAAFDNNGGMSFPSALENVIGVACNDSMNKNNELTLITNSKVNILSKRVNYKVAWIKPEYNVMNGSSYLCAIVSAKIANEFKKSNDFNLRNICSSIITRSFLKFNVIPFKIARAVTFPFNKEIHSLVRYADLLNFKIIDYYTLRLSGLIGKDISDIVKDCSFHSIIKNIDEIDWNSFDTLILGHCSEYSQTTGINYKEIISDLAKKFNKNIFSFEDLNDYKYNNLYIPKITNENITDNFGMLYKSSKPVICIVGTNSKQGKFTLQLYMRKRLIEAGYKVGQIGTEPSSELFGMDYAFHSGYASTINLSYKNIFLAINTMIHDITNKDVDLILAGTQSGLLAYNNRNTNIFPIIQQIFFQAIMPDVVVICVNTYDKIDFVKKIKNTVEGLSSAKVVGFVCFPFESEQNWKGNFGNKQRLSNEKEQILKGIYEEEFKLGLYFLDNKEELDELIHNCLLYFKA